MTLITEFAPAKINLTLEVLGKRPDGYHELVSLVAFARDAGDAVTLDTSLPVGSTVTGPFGATIAGANLIDVTLAKLAAAEPRLQLGHVTLEKNLPVAAGIGGGSADAAAVLRAVRRANPQHDRSLDWAGFAATLGADVPVCFAATNAIMGGTGEVLVPSQSLSPVAVVLVNPRVPVPADKTAQVFRTLKAPPLTANYDRDAALCMPSLQGLSGLLAYMDQHRNDLEGAATTVVPEIATVKAALAACAGVGSVRLSGGGPTCFGVFETLQKASLAADLLAAHHPHWWVKASLLS